MDYLFIGIGVLILAAAFTAVGFVIRDKQIGKHKDTVLNYMALTPQSKKLVNGYIKARTVNDERTTYKERH